ncbi:acyltransferase [Emcibacteraceae bacterium]|nr:acyltransferase [Emcibacteraceae bacterium]
MEFIDKDKNIYILALNITIGARVTFGRNINIRLHGNFDVGEGSHLGNNLTMTGNNVSIGCHFYNSSGFKVGGGGSQNPGSNLTIGDRCVIHNSYINTASTVTIGDDVGFSNHVDIITHGFWASVLDGYPASFEGVTIGNNVIFGYRTSILMGADICDDVVIGAHSLISKRISEPGIYVGSPVRFIRGIEALSDDEKVKKLDHIISSYETIAEYHGVKYTVEANFPWVKFNRFNVNTETFEYSGVEDAHSDDFRDFLRKWGIRIYTDRPFKSMLNPPR